MWKPRYLALALVAASFFFPRWAGSQPSGRPPSLIETLNKEAEASDPEGIRKYSQHLTQLLVGQLLVGERASTAYTASLSDRLAKSEELARQGKRKLISDEVIAEAFNDLMQQTAAPSSFKADVADVEKSRRGFERELPAVISEGKNGKYCYPGEAMWVMSMLIENIGSHPPSPVHPGPQVSGYRPPVRLYLVRYFSSRSPDEAIHVLERLTLLTVPLPGTGSN
jgi:hypothetical protein